MSPMRRRRKRFDTGNKKSPAIFNPVISVRGCLSHTRWLSRFCDYHYRLSLISRDRSF
jgi:hypothetical protein